MNRLLDSPRLEAEGFGFNDHHRGQVCRRPSTWWTKFPRRFQFKYLHGKITQYPRSKCIFSMYVHQMLDVPHAPRTAEDEWLLADKLIEAWLCGKYRGVRSWLDPGYYRHHLDRELYWLNTPEETARWWKMFETLLPIALVTCAISRGDVAESRALIRQCECRPDFSYQCVTMSGGYRFGGICPMFVAAKSGSAEIVRALLVDDCGNYRDPGYISPVLALMATSGNREGIKAWIEVLKEQEQRIERLDLAVQYSIRGGDFQMVDFIE